MKNQKGITLIALVITIIVMVIIAGAAIATFTLQDGYFTKMTDAVENYSGKVEAMDDRLETIEGYLERHLSN